MKRVVVLNMFKYETLMHLLLIFILLYARWNALPVPRPPFLCHQNSLQTGSSPRCTIYIWECLFLFFFFFFLCLVFAETEDKNWHILGAGQPHIFRYFWKNLSVCGTAPWRWCSAGGRLGWKVLVSWHQLNLKAKPEAKPKCSLWLRTHSVS